MGVPKPFVGGGLGQEWTGWVTAGIIFSKRFIIRSWSWRLCTCRKFCWCITRRTSWHASSTARLNLRCSCSIASKIRSFFRRSDTCDSLRLLRGCDLQIIKQWCYNSKNYHSKISDPNSIKCVTWSQKNFQSSLSALLHHRWCLYPLRNQCTRVKNRLVELTEAPKIQVGKLRGQPSGGLVGSYGNGLVPLTRSSQ